MLDLGATSGVNYATSPNWTREVLDRSDDNGVNLVVDVAGDVSGLLCTLAVGGVVGLVGQSLGGSHPIRPVDIREWVRKVATVRSLMVGSTASLRATYDRMVPDESPSRGRSGAPVLRGCLRQLPAGGILGKIAVSLG